MAGEAARLVFVHLDPDFVFFRAHDDPAVGVQEPYLLYTRLVHEGLKKGHQIIALSLAHMRADHLLDDMGEDVRVADNLLDHLLALVSQESVSETDHPAQDEDDEQVELEAKTVKIWRKMQRFQHDRGLYKVMMSKQR